MQSISKRITISSHFLTIYIYFSQIWWSFSSAPQNDRLVLSFVKKWRRAKKWLEVVVKRLFVSFGTPSMRNWYWKPLVKFICSEKATKLCYIFPLLLTACYVVKSKGKILQNFVAFSKYLNFIYLCYTSPFWISLNYTARLAAPFLCRRMYLATDFIGLYKMINLVRWWCTFY